MKKKSNFYKLSLTQENEYNEPNIIQNLIMERLNKRGVDDCNTFWYLYRILKHHKYFSEKRSFKLHVDTYAWCKTIKNYQCIFFRSCNCENFVFIIILYYGKNDTNIYINKKYFKVFRVYDTVPVNHSVLIDDNDRYRFANVDMTFTDNLEGNDFVSRPDLTYIIDNIEKLLYEENFNYKINPIFEYSEQPRNHEINLHDLYAFFNTSSYILDEIENIMTKEEFDDYK